MWDLVYPSLSSIKIWIYSLEMRDLVYPSLSSVFFFFFFKCVQTFFFKDSYVGEEPALFYLKKDNKEAKPMTLITHPLIIGEFSPKWDWDICPPNLSQWS